MHLKWPDDFILRQEATIGLNVKAVALSSNEDASICS